LAGIMDWKTFILVSSSSCYLSLRHTFNMCTAASISSVVLPPVLNYLQWFTFATWRITYMLDSLSLFLKLSMKSLSLWNT